MDRRIAPSHCVGAQSWSVLLNLWLQTMVESSQRILNARNCNLKVGMNETL
jgi:hypothetical protein